MYRLSPNTSNYEAGPARGPIGFTPSGTYRDNPVSRLYGVANKPVEPSELSMAPTTVQPRKVPGTSYQADEAREFGPMGRGVSGIRELQRGLTMGESHAQPKFRFSVPTAQQEGDYRAWGRAAQDANRLGREQALSGKPALTTQGIIDRLNAVRRDWEQKMPAAE
jgi:hypothetical protein